MAMNYTSLIGAKNVSGSIATWVSYSLLDIPPIVDEAQALLYSLLRTREMRTELAFSMPVGGASLALPSRFLDPIGRIYTTSFNNTIRHKDENTVQRTRVYTENSGALTNPFTTVAGSPLVSVALANHGLTQDSVFYYSSSDPAWGSGTYPVVSITDANNFVFSISPGAATLSGTSGSAVTYLADALTLGFPVYFSIWDEAIRFDQAFSQQTLCKLQYFQSLPLLSASNQTNFLTNRYPQLLRRACVTAAADFMKDDQEYQKDLTALSALVERVNVENDMTMRGMEIEADTP